MRSAVSYKTVKQELRAERRLFFFEEMSCLKRQSQAAWSMLAERRFSTHSSAVSSLGEVFLITRFGLFFRGIQKPLF